MTPAQRILRAATAALASLTLAQAAGASGVLVGFEDEALLEDNPTNTRVPLQRDSGGLTWSDGWWVQNHGFYNGANGNYLTATSSNFGQQHLSNLGAAGTDPPGYRPPQPVDPAGMIVSFESSVAFFLRNFYITGGLLADRVANSTATLVTVTGSGMDPSGAPFSLTRQISLSNHLGDLNTKDFLLFVDFTVATAGLPPGTAQAAWDQPITEVVFTPSGTLGENTVFLLDNVTIQYVPIPPSAVLLSGALAILGGLRRRREKMS